MRTIRASEIGTYLFCRRAWWFQSQGAPSQNLSELAGGSAYHHRHGRSVIRARLLRAAGWLLLLLAITLLVITLTLHWLG
ncbi:MAG TPA: hypothetical protein VF806_02500 [Anaerolineaceae bacterium]